MSNEREVAPPRGTTDTNPLVEPAVGGADRVRVGIVARPSRLARLQSLLLGHDQLVPVVVDDVDGLRALAAQGALDCVLMDPDLDASWPAQTMAELVEPTGLPLPSLIVCANANDAQLIATRFADRRLEVLLDDRATADAVSGLLHGLVATARAKGSGR